MDQRACNHVFMLASICWMGVIYYLSSQPGRDVPMLFQGQDKLMHLVIFGILGFLLTGAVRAARHGYRARPFWFVVALVMFYGIADEFHQLFVPGRSADIYDMLADSVGGLLGAGLMVKVTRIIRQQGNEAR
jgi:VanZ family protein